MHLIFYGNLKRKLAYDEKGEDISIGGITAIMMYNGLLSAPVNNIISMCIDLFKVNVDLAISTSLGFGGHNACIILKKYSE